MVPKYKNLNATGRARSKTLTVVETLTDPFEALAPDAWPRGRPPDCIVNGMATSVEVRQEQEPPSPETRLWPGATAVPLLWAFVGLVAYLCWCLIAPFVPALAFGFALAMLGQPVHAWLLRRLKRENIAAVVAVVLICLTIVVPVIFVIRVLVQEAVQGVGAIGNQQDVDSLRRALDNSTLFGPLIRWLGSQMDLPKEFSQLTRGLGQWLSGLVSSIVSGSARVVTQMLTMVVILFYFLRDQATILSTLRSFVPLSEPEISRLFTRVTETIRVSLYGKVVVALIQGGLGGLIFWWIGLPAPAFWGSIMALLSVLPALGAFVIWVPAATMLALDGQWSKALILVVWGFAIVHPVDNLLGPVLVGTKLHLHTLFIFFSVIGGLAAFGAAGIVLGPVTVAIAISLHEIRQERNGNRQQPS